MRIDLCTSPAPPYQPGGEPAWSLFAGELYGGSPFLLAPFLWWATGLATLALMAFVALAVLWPTPLWRLLRRAARALRRVFRNPADKAGFFRFYHACFIIQS